jgi:hypothetical protein
MFQTTNQFWIVMDYHGLNSTHTQICGIPPFPEGLNSLRRSELVSIPSLASQKRRWTSIDYDDP